jgi:hypothetical protein
MENIDFIWIVIGAQLKVFGNASIILQFSCHCGERKKNTSG